MPKNSKGPNSQAPKPAPGTILSVDNRFLVILDKEVRFVALRIRAGFAALKLSLQIFSAHYQFAIEE